MEGTHGLHVYLHKAHFHPSVAWGGSKWLLLTQKTASLAPSKGTKVGEKALNEFYVCVQMAQPFLLIQTYHNSHQCYIREVGRFGGNRLSGL